jgi:TldD protein
VKDHLAYGRDPTMRLPDAFESLMDPLSDIVADLTRYDKSATAMAARQDGLRIVVSAKEESASKLPPQAGVVFTAMRDGVVHERSVGSLERDSVAVAASELSNQLGPPTAGSLAIPSEVERFRTPMKTDPATVAFEEKFEFVRGIKNALMSCDDRAVNANVSYSEGRKQSFVVTESGMQAQEIKRIALSVMLFLHGDSGVRYAFDFIAGTVGWEAMTFSEERIEALKELTTALLFAKPPEPGVYDIVCAPDVAGTIAHESFGHGVEVDMYPKGRAQSVKFMGKRVGSDLVEMYDDPTVPGAFGSYFFDDQGYRAEPVHIVESGVYRRGLADGVAAAITDLPRSASGRRESIHNKVYTRMTNTFFARGGTPEADIISSIDDGMYVKRTLDGMEDPKGWGMQVRALVGRRIRNGKLTDQYFTPVGLTGYVPDVLGSVRMVGDNFELDGGFCGKGYKEYVPTASGGPTILTRARIT